MTQIDPFVPCEFENEFHAQFSIMFGQLVDEGYVDWSDGTWDFPKYSDEQDARLKQKIVDHFYLRELAIIPPVPPQAAGDNAEVHSPVQGA